MSSRCAVRSAATRVRASTSSRSGRSRGCVAPQNGVVSSGDIKGGDPVCRWTNMHMVQLSFPRRAAALALAVLVVPVPAAFAGKAKPVKTTTTATTTAVTTTTTTTAAPAPAPAPALVPWTLVAPATTPEPRPFSPRDFWDTQIPAGQAADPASASLVAELNRQVATYGTWISSTQYSEPVYTVSATQPRVPVILDNHPNSPLKDKFAAGVPLPSNARGASGTDSAAVVWQPSTDTYWEFWRLRKLADGFHAEYGGMLTNASTSPGVFTDGTGTSASGLALL